MGWPKGEARRDSVSCVMQAARTMQMSQPKNQQLPMLRGI